MRQLNEYFVYDPSKWEFGGVRVIKVGEDRKVRLTAAQARFWIDQSVIGEKHADEREPEAKVVATQMAGKAEMIPGEEPKVVEKPVDDEPKEVVVPPVVEAPVVDQPIV